MPLLSIDFTQAQVFAALVTGIVSIIIAMWTFFTGRISQKATATIQNEVEILKGKIADENSENAARRSYEY